ncbi:nucleotidyl transferase AbiEii/AbiGii toxin family protein [Pantoea sp. A4]|uniref:nucleotidyl transferase AbiEii/AbiGii toxin family protein n=1 Tax=Pantoea sp. A4 TaxID=1225184 RepID=UPI00036AD8C2|nr:nucleotidyl transferase AbiEii/AbiGii toxin family protein [Pantoea sp. A4]
MNLHENPELFRELISVTANAFNIPEIYVEKDYWVTRVLLKLSQSEYRENFVFKGGTALSKAFRIIHRFSEDVDLAFHYDGSLSANQVRNRIRAAEKAITQGLEKTNNPQSSAGSKFRKHYYQYPHELSGDFGHASAEILLEINSFTTPEPFTLMPVNTLIADFILTTTRQDLLMIYGLTTFNVNVLDIRRTIAEKILGLVRASHDEDISTLSAKIRHIYDLVMIRRQPEYHVFFTSDELHDLLNIVRASDRDLFQQAATWLDCPLANCRLFNAPEETWRRIEGTFRNGFAELVYDKSLPDTAEVTGLLRDVHGVLLRLDS